MSPVTTYSSSKISVLYKPMYIHPYPYLFFRRIALRAHTPFFGVRRIALRPIKSRAFRKMAVVVRGGAKSAGAFWGVVSTHSALGGRIPVRGGLRFVTGISTSME
jgi:hypothetical protein